MLIQYQLWSNVLFCNLAVINQSVLKNKRSHVILNGSLTYCASQILNDFSIVSCGTKTCNLFGRPCIVVLYCTYLWFVLILVEYGSAEVLTLWQWEVLLQHSQFGMHSRARPTVLCLTHLRGLKPPGAGFPVIGIYKELSASLLPFEILPLWPE